MNGGFIKNVIKANKTTDTVITKAVAKDAEQTVGSVIKDVGSINPKVSEDAHKVISAKRDKLIEEVGQAPYGVVPSSQEIDGITHEGYRYQFLNKGAKEGESKLGDEYFISAFRTKKL